jgi:hypothetical protein
MYGPIKVRRGWQILAAYLPKQGLGIYEYSCEKKRQDE